MPQTNTWLIASHANTAVIHVKGTSSVHVFTDGEWSSEVKVPAMPRDVNQIALTHRELIVGDFGENNVRVYPWRDNQPSLPAMSWGPVQARIGRFALLPSRQLVCWDQLNVMGLVIYDLGAGDPAASAQRVTCDDVPGMPHAAIAEHTLLCGYNKSLMRLVKLSKQ